MKQFTRKTDRSQIKVNKTKYVSRQRMVDNKINEIAENRLNVPTQYQNELLKMEKRIYLEAKYHSFQRTNENIEDVEIALAKMFQVFKDTRYHILAAERELTSNEIFTVMLQYVHGNNVPHYNSFINNKITFERRESLNALEQSRIFLFKIFVVRYPDSRLTTFFKKGLKSKNFKNTPKAEGLRDWITEKIVTIREWFSGVWTGITTQLPVALQTAYDLIQRVKDYITSSVIHIVANISSQVMILIVTSIAIIGVCGIALIPLIRRLIYWMAGNCKENPVEMNDCVAEGDTNDRTKSIMGTTGAIITKTLDSKAIFDPEAWFNKFAKYSNNFNSIERCLTSIWGMFKPMVEFTYSKITGKPLTDLGLLNKEISESATILNEHRIKYSQSKRITSDDAEIVYLHSERLKTKQAEKLHAVSPSLASTASVVLLNCLEVIEAAREIKYGAKTRPMPVWIHLVGKPGVGKTMLTNNMISWLEQMFHGKITENNRYDRKVNNEYWDGYAHQFATVVDDYQQSNEVEERRLAALEMIYAVNSNPFHLHMASVAEKKGQYFDSEIVITSSNFDGTFLPSNLGITDTRALYRRMHLKLYVERDFTQPDNDQPWEDAMNKFKFYIVDNQGNRNQKFVRINYVLSSVLAFRMKHSKEYRMNSMLKNPEALEKMIADVDKMMKIAHPDYVEKQEEKVDPQGEADSSDPDDAFMGEASGYSDQEADDNLWDDFEMEMENELNRSEESFDQIDYGEEPYGEMDGTPISDDDDGSEEDDHEYIREYTEEELRIIKEKEAKLQLYDETKQGSERKHTVKNNYSPKMVMDTSTIKTVVELKNGDEWESRKMKIPQAVHTEIHSDIVKIMKDEDDKFDMNLIQRRVRNHHVLRALKNIQERDAGSLDPERMSAVLNYMTPNDSWSMERRKSEFEKNPYDYVARSKGDYGMRHEPLVASMIEKHNNIAAITNKLERKPYGWSTIPQRIFGSWVENRHSANVRQAIKNGNMSTPKSYADYNYIDKQGIQIEDILLYMEDKLRGNCTDTSTDPWLDLIAVVLNIQTIKNGNSYRWFYNTNPYQVYFTPPFWRDQVCGNKLKAIFHFGCPEGTHELIWTRSLFGIGTDCEVKNLNRSERQVIEDILRDQMDLNEEKMTDIANTALAIIAGLSVAAILTIVIKTVTRLIVSIFAQDENAMGESFDKNSETKALKHLRKGKKVHQKKFNKPGKVTIRQPSKNSPVAESTVVDLTSIFARNTEFVTFNGKEGVATRSYVLFLGGRTFATAAHAFRAFDIESITVHWTRDMEHGKIDISKSQYTVTMPDSRDLAIVNIKVTALQQYPNISKHLFTLNDWVSFRTKEVMDIGRFHFNKDGEYDTILVKKAVPVVYTSVRVGTTSYTATDMMLVRDMYHTGGYCGLPYFTNNTKYGKTLLGIHNGGLEEGSLFTPIWVEDLKGIDAHANPVGECVEISIEDIYPKQDEFELHFNKGTKVVGAKLIGEIKRVKDGKKHIIYEPSTTNLKQTPFNSPFTYNKEVIMPIFDCNKVPVNLKPFEEKDTMVIPMDRAMENWKDRNMPVFPDQCKDSRAFNGIFHKNFDIEQVRVISLVEAINGVRGSAFIGPLDFSTSSSIGFSDRGIVTNDMFNYYFPIEEVQSKYKKNSDDYELLVNSQVTAPNEFLEYFYTNLAADETWSPYECDPDKYIKVNHQTYKAYTQLSHLKYLRIPNEELAGLLLRRDRKYYQTDNPPPFVCIGTLKDETKLKEKRNKPRLFCNGSKVSLIEARQYCASFFEQVIKHTGEGDVYIGLNPHGISWRVAFEKLKQHGLKKSIADDISKWDWHMRIIFVGYLIDEMKKRGINDKVIYYMRLVLMSTLCPYIVIGGNVHQVLAMPSGSYLTAMLNSMYNSWMIRVLWLVRNDEMEEDLDFDEFIALLIFGDDNHQTVSESLDNEFWNGNVIARLRKQYFGMTTTSIFKDGRDIPDFMPTLVDTWADGHAQFIKRQFRSENGAIFPILDIESINSMLTWVRPNKDRSLDVCIKDNIETALRELCYYPRETFDIYFNYFQKFYNLKKWGLIPISFTAQRAHYFSS